jgi:hypothetical protein
MPYPRLNSRCRSLWAAVPVVLVAAAAFVVNLDRLSPSERADNVSRAHRIDARTSAGSLSGTRTGQTDRCSGPQRMGGRLPMER